ncbi:DUF4381 domain-containing protein [Candidatus Marimicrobium litorale]|uniref:DUF4381 domain-containing protein n=1 Tax=Candidatus Marimicrobium litorale TaxID=2518991 RepID=A0ABT3T2Z6_9GAMM|nr:DUF4381 domain-containing protein [Candidatus Marimicrobium litorale]MCX2976220.1 DUF4381 domain-containing protein [Candidatus Marimicrobium litorale]
MNPEDPLAGLNPLREPMMIGWWPPAPGWWALLLLVLLVVAFVIVVLRRRYRRNAYRREALRQLQNLHQDYQSGGDASRYLASVNALLKSVALQAYPRADVASRFGATWLQIINRDLPEGQRLGAEFNDAVYRKTPENLDITRILPAARYWICHHKVTP